MHPQAHRASSCRATARPLVEAAAIETQATVLLASLPVGAQVYLMSRQFETLGGPVAASLVLRRRSRQRQHRCSSRLSALSIYCVLTESFGRKLHDYLGRHSHAVVGRLAISCRLSNRLLIA